MNMIQEARLKEKLKYIFLLEIKDKFPLKSFDIDFDYYSKDGQNFIDIYTVSVELDLTAFGGVDFITDMSVRLHRVSDVITGILTKYPISPTGEFHQNVDVHTSEPMIWSVDYKWDEKFNVAFNVMVKYDD